MTYRQLRTTCFVVATVLTALWLQYEVVTDETLPWVSYIEPLPDDTAPAEPPAQQAVQPAPEAPPTTLPSPAAPTTPSSDLAGRSDLELPVATRPDSSVGDPLLVRSEAAGSTSGSG